MTSGAKRVWNIALLKIRNGSFTKAAISYIDWAISSAERGTDICVSHASRFDRGSVLLFDGEALSVTGI